MTRIVLGLLRLYQIVLSPFTRGACRHYPSCSQYAREAVERHGVLRGGRLAFKRVMRCHPLGSSGYDPVPR